MVTVLKPVNQSKALFRGAFILTIAAFITKILSAFYRIPFQNIVGDVGFYIYQQVYPFYGIAVVLSTTGFPVVISKLYAEQRLRPNQREKRQLFLFSFLFLQAVGLLCFAVLFFGSGRIALWMNDTQLSILLKTVSFVFLVFPFVSTMRGYYQGNGDMVPTALSQVGEQLTRVLTIIIAALLLTKGGYSLYLTGSGAMFGSITGSLAASIILFTFVRKRKEWKRDILLFREWRSYTNELKRIFAALAFQGLAICVSGMLLIFMQMADSMNLYSLLVSTGIDPEAAKSLKGVFDRGQPLIQLGTVAATSMSLSLVPLISSSRLKGNRSDLLEKINTSMKISVVIAAGASVGLWAIIRPTNIMLFENGSGSFVLGILSFVILFNSMISTMIAIMQGLGRLIFPAVVILAAFLLKYVLNLLLIPAFGTAGAAAATIITLFLVVLALFFELKRFISIPVFSFRFMLTVLAAAAVMALFLKGYLSALEHILAGEMAKRWTAAFEALSSAVLGGFIFLIIIIRAKVFLDEELTLFPLGSKLRLLLPRKDRS